MKSGGLTLIELLVALAISLVLLALLFDLQGQVMRGSQQQTVRAARLQAVTDVAGYLGDTLKPARTVLPDSAAAPDRSGSSACTWGAAQPCLAAIVPAVPPHTDCPSGSDPTWDLVAWRYVPRRDLGRDEKVASPALDAQAAALVEYRLTCPAVPGDVPLEASHFSGTATRAVVETDLHLGSEAAFAVDDEGSDQGMVTLRLRGVGLKRGQLQYTPPAGDYVLHVMPRNLTAF